MTASDARLELQRLQAERLDALWQGRRGSSLKIGPRATAYQAARAKLMDELGLETPPTPAWATTRSTWPTSRPTSRPRGSRTSPSP